MYSSGVYVIISMDGKYYPALELKLFFLEWLMILHTIWSYSLLFLLFFVAPGHVLGQGLLSIDGDFENGLGTFAIESCCSHSFTTARNLTRHGLYGARFELRRTDGDVAGSKRVEAKTSFPFTQDMWFNLNYLFPASYLPESSREMVAQWHDLPDQGEPWQAPSTSIWVSNNRLYLTNRWQFAKIGNNVFDGQNDYDLGPITLDRWTNIVVHVHWALDTSGRIELWRDGIQQVYQEGPNIYNDDRFPYLKFGIYKYNWKTTPSASKYDRRVLYVDDIRIGNERSNYAEVSTLGLPFLIENFTAPIDTFQVIRGGWQRRQGVYRLTNPVLQGPTILTNLTLHPVNIPPVFKLRVNALVAPSSTRRGNFAILFNYRDQRNYSYVSFSESAHSTLNGLYTVENGVRRPLLRFPTYITGGRWYHIEIGQHENSLEVWRDNTLVARALGITTTSGRVGFSSYDDIVSFDDLGIYYTP
jgi:hypothetical protein